MKKINYIGMACLLTALMIGCSSSENRGSEAIATLTTSQTNALATLSRPTPSSTSTTSTSSETVSRTTNTPQIRTSSAGTNTGSSCLNFTKTNWNNLGVIEEPTNCPNSATVTVDNAPHNLKSIKPDSEMDC